MRAINKIIAGGTPAILAAGGGVMYLQHEIHYLLRPSIIETLAGIATVGGAIVWSKNRKKEETPAPPTSAPAPAPLTEQEQPRMVIWEAQEPQALPRAQKTTTPTPNYVKRNTVQRHER